MSEDVKVLTTKVPSCELDRRVWRQLLGRLGLGEGGGYNLCSFNEPHVKPKCAFSDAISASLVPSLVNPSPSVEGTQVFLSFGRSKQDKEEISEREGLSCNSRCSMCCVMC